MKRLPWCHQKATKTQKKQQPTQTPTNTQKPTGHQVKHVKHCAFRKSPCLSVLLRHETEYCPPPSCPQGAAAKAANAGEQPHMPGTPQPPCADCLENIAQNAFLQHSPRTGARKALKQSAHAEEKKKNKTNHNQRNKTNDNPTTTQQNQTKPNKTKQNQTKPMTTNDNQRNQPKPTSKMIFWFRAARKRLFTQLQLPQRRSPIVERKTFIIQGQTKEINKFQNKFILREGQDVRCKLLKRPLCRMLSSDIWKVALLLLAFFCWCQLPGYVSRAVRPSVSYNDAKRPVPIREKATKIFTIIGQNNKTNQLNKFNKLIFFPGNLALFFELIPCALEALTGHQNVLWFSIATLQTSSGNAIKCSKQGLGKGVFLRKLGTQILLPPALLSKQQDSPQLPQWIVNPFRTTQAHRTRSVLFT